MPPSFTLGREARAGLILRAATGCYLYLRAPQRIDRGRGQRLLEEFPDDLSG